MSPEDIRKLLGGYATGTLTAEEQQALFAAALEDQELFDALAREQSLRDLLRDPAARAELLSALDGPARPAGGFWQWLRHPAVAGLAAAGVAAIAVVAVWRGTRVPLTKPVEPVMVAELRRQEQSLARAPVPSAPPAASEPEQAKRDNSAGGAATAMEDSSSLSSMRLPTPSQPADGKRDRAADAPALVAAAKKTAHAMPLPAANEPENARRDRGSGALAGMPADKGAAPARAVAPPLRQFMPGTQNQVAEAPTAVMKNQKEMAAMAPTPPAPAPAPPLAKPSAPAVMPVFAARKAEADAARPGSTTESITVTAESSVLTVAGEDSAGLPVDARSLFYLDQLAPRGNAFVDVGGVAGGIGRGTGGGIGPGVGGAPAATSPAAPQADLTLQTAETVAVAPRKAKAPTGPAAPVTAATPRLGVRASILRGQAEADLTTVLDPGETVRLKLIPNADGFLYVVDGARLVASGAATRLKPFETPELRFKGRGQKKLYVMLSRTPRVVAPRSLGNLVGGNLVETSPDRERATYVVAGPREPGAQQVVVAVTLTYR